jgi:Common central domain of tyrosinase
MMNYPKILSIVFAAGLVAGVNNTLVGQVLPRENINTFSQSPAKVQKLRDAVAALQARGPNHSASWITMAGIHQMRSGDPDFAQTPASIRALFSQCHRTDADEDEPLFFLWHRAYVAAMERLMKEAIGDPSFRLPYWNWYVDQQLPESFRKEFIDDAGTQKNPLYRGNRNRGVNNGDPIGLPALVTDYANSDFRSFQFALNFNEHGEVHGLIGTSANMGNPVYAAKDPIFYLHHTNIDRLLMAWRKRHPRATIPTPTATEWPADNRFPVPPGSTGNTPPPVKTPTTAELALGSLQAMDYTYDNMDLPTVGLPAVPAAPQHLEAAAAAERSSESDSKTFSTLKAAEKPIQIAAGGTVELSILPNDRQKILKLADVRPSEKQAEALMLVFDRIQLKEPPPGLASYRVFVNLPREGASPEAFRDHFVGTISIFKLQGAEGHRATSVKLRFTPSQGAQAIKKALGNESDAPTKINISFVPVLAPGAVAPKETVFSIGEIRLERSAQ